jgi:hypothetical protein
MAPITEFDLQIRKAIRHFWKTRARQSRNQGKRSGTRDTGARSAVTGGHQMDGFVELIRELLLDAGVRNDQSTSTKHSSCQAGSGPKNGGICW